MRDDAHIPVAMILAAGRGTRLRPLTDQMPKALAPLNHKPLLYYVLLRLQSQGVNKVIINVHHFAEKIREYLDEQPFPGLEIHISDESALLLDTGGALSNVLPLLEGENEVLVHNVDVISDISIRAMLRQHRERQAEASLAVRERKSSRYLRFSSEGRLCGWENAATGEVLWSGPACHDADRLAFSGIHIVNTRLIRKLPPDGAFPIIPEYLRLASSSRIDAYPHSHSLWTDLGRPEDLAGMDQWLQTKEGIQWTRKYLQGWSPS